MAPAIDWVTTNGGNVVVEIDATSVFERYVPTEVDGPLILVPSISEIVLSLSASTKSAATLQLDDTC